MGAGLAGGHAATHPAVEGVLEEQRLNTQLALVELREDVLGIVGAVVAAYARVIAADDEVGAAVVAPHQGVEDSLPRAGVAHERWQYVEAVFPHGENWKEFVYMVEGGMPPMEAIQCATMRAAELLEIDDILGSVEAGKYADLVAVDQNPLVNIAVMENVTFVMKDGVVYKHL